MDLIERIGPVLGIVALFGLAVLSFLLFQQSRDIRRLREWAGRAPERAKEAADASLAAAEARGEAAAEAAGEGVGLRARIGSRLGAVWRRVAEAARPRLREVDRRLPVDPRYVVIAVVLAVGVAAALTSGFGLFGDEGRDRDRRAGGGGGKPDVAILNGTQTDGLASKVDTGVVKPAGYDSRALTNTTTSFAETVVMYAPGHEDQASALATTVRDELGETPTQEMSDEVRSRAAGAPLALVLGLDDSGFGSSG